jgi:hypothetical protein
VQNVFNTGVFKKSDELKIIIDESHIPYGWESNDTDNDFTIYSISDEPCSLYMHFSNNDGKKMKYKTNYIDWTIYNS